jgi:two-component system LytT family response regulator
MRQFTALVIDDEEKLRKVLKIKLAKHCPAISILGEAADAEQAYDEIVSHRPEIIFLDIAMPKASGFELLKRFDPVDFEVIFVTGYSEYALQALKIAAVDYLLKPVINEELIQAVEKAKERILSKIQLANIELLKHNTSYHLDQRSKLSIPSMQSYEQVQISDIIRCEGEQRYTRVYIRGDIELLSSYSIGRFRELLSGYAFLECHKSHLVNSVHIARYNKDGQIIMKDETEVPVSRRKRDEIKHQIVKLIAERK